jgi:hypothetical protein
LWYNANMLNKDFLQIEISFIQDELAKFTQFGSYSIRESIDNALVSVAIQKFLDRIVEQAVRINQYLVIELMDTKNPPLDYAETFRSLANCQVYEKEFADRIVRSVETKNSLDQGVVLEEGNDRIYIHIYECIDDYYRYCEKVLKFLEGYSKDKQ